MPSIPVSKTKIIPPRRRAELLTRQRLLDLLFEALDKKLTLISAPAGYGKTSLLIDLAHNSELPCCWLALDELDREPQRFAAYFIAALAERFPKFGSRSKSVLEGMVSFEQDMERLLVTLVNELYEQVPEYFIFVLDDFHLLEGAAPIQNFVNRFVQLVDDNCHLVISSRILTGLNDLPLLVAREQVSGLNFSDLAFQPQELQALLAQNNNVHISDEEAARLIEEAEGWITGLQFSGANILSRSSSHAIMRDSAGLFEYFDQQVLDRQPPDLREFILRTSLLEEFDASLCETVLAPLYPEPQDWEERIKWIARNNLFALPVGEDGRWLRYHHLFRDFIRHRFERERPAEIKPILARLQRAYESMGEWEKAHHICRQLDDAAALAEMIERAGTSMLQSAHLTMESWLNELPPSLVRTRPGLLSIRGAITYTKGDLQGGLELLNEAERLYRREGNTYGLILTLIRRATAHRFLGDYGASLNDAEEIIKFTETSDHFQVQYADALRLKGLALYRLGKAQKAVAFLEHSLELHRLNDKSNIPVLLMETGMVYRAVGNFEAARNAYEKALQIWRREGNLYWQASLLNNLAILYQFLGKYEKSALAFEEGLLCAQRSHYTRLEGLISIGLGDLYAELEDFDMAQQNYRHAADALQSMDDRFLHHSLALAQANLAFLQKDPARAREFVGQVAGSILSGNSNYEQGLLKLVCGRLFLLEGKARKAAQELESAERCFTEDGREIEAAVSRIWRAAACHQDGNRAESLRILLEPPASRNKTPHALLVAVHQSREWLNGLQGNSANGRALRDLFTQANRLADKIPSIRRQLRRQARVVLGPAPRLAIQAFGKAVVSVEGKPLSLSDWQTQSVRDLFFYFLSAAKPLTKEQIGEVLWPGFYDASKLKLRFKNEIYRLRRAVGQDAILFKDALYSFNRSLDYEYDVEAFEAYLAGAKQTADTIEQIELYQKAVDLVTGPYLDDVYADWAFHDRERLSQAFLTALVSLGDLCQRNAQPERALAASRRAMEYDPVFEPAYRLAMQVYSRLNDRAAIRRTYEVCVETLKNRLDMPPSEETEELYRRLTR